VNQNVWYREAKRMLENTRALKEQKKMPNEWWQPNEYRDVTRCCQQCKNILYMTKRDANNNKNIKCGICHKSLINKYYECHNHKDSVHYYCEQDVWKYCINCMNEENVGAWHDENKCPNSKRKRSNKKDKANALVQPEITQEEINETNNKLIEK